MKWKGYEIDREKDRETGYEMKMKNIKIRISNLK